MKKNFKESFGIWRHKNLDGIVYISALEKGDRTGTIETLKKLAAVLKVDIDMLS